MATWLPINSDPPEVLIPRCAIIGMFAHKKRREICSIEGKMCSPLAKKDGETVIGMDLPPVTILDFACSGYSC
jgi:hypothetical protein